MKKHKKAEWNCPPGRSAFNMTKLEFSLEYIKQIQKIKASDKNKETKPWVKPNNNNG